MINTFLTKFMSHSSKTVRIAIFLKDALLTIFGNFCKSFLLHGSLHKIIAAGVVLPPPGNPPSPRDSHSFKMFKSLFLHTLS